MIYFLIYLFLEIFVSVEIASAIGPFWTFVEVIVSAMVGLVLLANFRNTFVENFQALAAGAIDPDTFQKQNMAALIGAILLIVPGFLTDILGVLLQFGVFANIFAAKLAARGRRNRHVDTNPTHQGDTDVIDVEIVDPFDDRR